MTSSFVFFDQNIFTTALNAKSEADLSRAGEHFSSAVAMIGVNVVIAMVAHTAAKGVNAKLKASAAQRKAVTAREIQAKLNAQKANGSSNQAKPNQSTAKPGQTKAEYKAAQQQTRVQGFDPKTRTDVQLAKDVSPTPRPGETAKQAKTRAKTAQTEIELRKAMNSSGLTREFIAAFKSPVIAQKTAVTYNSYGNWAAIKPIIGKPMSAVDAKSLGYLYANIEGKSKYYLATPIPGKVPQIMENNKGTAYVPATGENRLANEDLYTKNLKAENMALIGVNEKLIPNSQIHHLIGDSIWRKIKFLQTMLAKGIGHMDEGINTIELAISETDLIAARAKYPSVKFSDILHQSQHPKFDNIAETILLEILKIKEKKLKIDWEDFTPIQMRDVLKETVDHIRDLFLNHPNKLPEKSNGTLGQLPIKPQEGMA